MTQTNRDRDRDRDRDAEYEPHAARTTTCPLGSAFVDTVYQPLKLSDALLLCSRRAAKSSPSSPSDRCSSVQLGSPTVVVQTAARRPTLALHMLASVAVHLSSRAASIQPSSRCLHLVASLSFSFQAPSSSFLSASREPVIIQEALPYNTVAVSTA